jgi:uncharacterized membrane protein
MHPRFSDYGYILATILLTVYGQLVIKWQVSNAGSLPIGSYEKVEFIFSLLLKPAIFSGFLAAFLASLCWMAAMTKFELSYAYPFMSLNFILVTLLSIKVLGETVSVTTALGIGLIVLGTVVASKG